jgi:hypothetical protein
MRFSVLLSVFFLTAAKTYRYRYTFSGTYALNCNEILSVPVYVYRYFCLFCFENISVPVYVFRYLCFKTTTESYWYRYTFTGTYAFETTTESYRYRYTFTRTYAFKTTAKSYRYRTGIVFRLTYTCGSRCDMLSKENNFADPGDTFKLLAVWTAFKYKFIL